MQALVRRSNFDTYSDTAEEKLGQVYTEVDATNGGTKSYRYVQFLDAVTYVKGHVCVFAAANFTKVTNDRAGGSAIAGNLFAGVTLGIPTQNQYGWVQARGHNSSVSCPAGIGIGDPLAVDSATDGLSINPRSNVAGTPLQADVQDTIDDSTTRFIGAATTAVASSLCSAYLAGVFC